MLKISVSSANSNNVIVLNANVGDNLMDVLRNNGYGVAAYCGGNGKCGKCRVLVDDVDSLACRTILHEDCRVILTAGQSEIVTQSIKINVQESNCEELMFAVDIGTTTIALALISAANGSVLSARSANNPQIAYGSDVIARIKYCGEGGLDRLHNSIIDCLNRIIESMLDEYSGKIVKIIVSGNVTMLHLLLGVDCTSIGVAPYTAAFVGEQRMCAMDIGLNLDCDLITMPSIASFVGSDIVAGILHCGYPKINKYNILIDLGTNAEIAIYNSNQCICTAAAAGPCFEGANIECGVSAVSGAINGFSIVDGKQHFTTINDEEPIGVCGTGLIDIISNMCKCGVIDESGALTQSNTYSISEKVYITQRDIREFQLAKSAVRAATETLLKVLNITDNDIDKVYLAGGFASYINIDNAVICGLISHNLGNKCDCVGNSSLQGAIKFAVDKVDNIIVDNHCKYIDLTLHSDFTELFMEYMSFEEND